MGDHRKKIVIEEIENWRKNHLLPEHYCIFLLNLYTEGERQATSAPSGKGGFGSQGSEVADSRSLPHSGVTNSYGFSWKMIFSWFVGACFIAGIILLAFHFTRFSILMQITIFSCFALFFYMLSFVLRRVSTALTHISLAITFLLLTLGGMYILNHLDVPKTGYLFYLTIVCLLWCLNGLLFGYAYLLYCGILGLGLMYGVATSDRIAINYRWWQAELYWVPIACLMIGLGFLLHNRNRVLACVLAICGIIFFFGPEIQSLYIPRAKHDVIQLLLFIKVFISSTFFFLTRSYWFHWLRL